MKSQMYEKKLANMVNWEIVAMLCVYIGRFLFNPIHMRFGIGFIVIC